MPDVIRIDELNPATPDRNAVVPTMKDGVAGRLSIAQILSKIVKGDFIGLFAAADIDFTPAGNVAATKVQAAIEEVDSEKLAKSANLSDLSNVPTSRANLGVYSKAETGRAAGARNAIINGDGRINQEGVTSAADDVYGHDQHYALTQTGAIGISTLDAPADGIASMMRLTQSQASAQRFGYAQPIEAKRTKAMRGKTGTFGGKLRCSSSQAIRFALLEWTGTADTLTSDVVNDWTSASYTPGSFFLASNIIVRGLGTITPAANTITDWNLTATIGSTANNLIVFFWTEATAAQNVTLDQRWYLVEGDATAESDPFPVIDTPTELGRCRWFYRQIGEAGFKQANAGTVSGRQFLTANLLDAPMRVAPAMSWSNEQAYSNEGARTVVTSGSLTVTAVGYAGSAVVTDTVAILSGAFANTTAMFGFCVQNVKLSARL